MKDFWFTNNLLFGNSNVTRTKDSRSRNIEKLKSHIIGPITKIDIYEGKRELELILKFILLC